MMTLITLQKSIDFKTEDSQCSDHDDFSDADYCLPIKNGPLDVKNMRKCSK